MSMLHIVGVVLQSLAQGLFHLICLSGLPPLDSIRIEDVLDLGEKFNDVLFVSRNTASLVERCTVNTTDILVLGERIHDSLVVCE